MSRSATLVTLAGSAALTLLVGACSSSSPAAVPAPASSPAGLSSAAGTASPIGPATSTPNSPAAGQPTPTGSPGSGASPTPLVTEVNPPGDIPDNQAYVPYRVPGSPVTVKIPEGWSRSTSAGATTFSAKLNSVTIAASSVPAAPTVASIRARAASTLAGSVPNYAFQNVKTVQRSGQSVVLLTYLGDSAPDPVTGKVVRDAFEQYTYWKSGTQAVLTLAGPTNADNVDPWRAVSDSVSFA